MQADFYSWVERVNRCGPTGCDAVVDFSTGASHFFPKLPEVLRNPLLGSTHQSSSPVLNRHLHLFLSY
jgi:hypothetical protein